MRFPWSTVPYPLLNSLRSFNTQLHWRLMLPRPNFKLLVMFSCQRTIVSAKIIVIRWIKPLIVCNSLSFLQAMGLWNKINARTMTLRIE